MNIPENVKYTSDHEWIKIDGNEAVVGITDFAQGELGDIVFVEIETEGEEIAHGEVFGTIEAVKTVSDLFMPVAGLINEVNAELQDNPELINEDPFGKGWLIKVEIKEDSTLADLMDAKQYADLISS